MEVTLNIQHSKKIWPEFFQAILDGKKPWEIRVEDPTEKPFQVGDLVLFKEWETSPGRYTGRWMVRRITYVLRDSRFLPRGTVCFSHEIFGGTNA